MNPDFWRQRDSTWLAGCCGHITAWQLWTAPAALSPVLLQQVPLCPFFLLSTEAGAAWLSACPRPPFFKMPCTAEMSYRGDHEASLCPSSSFLCSPHVNQVVQSHDNIPSVPQGTSGSDLPPCQHPEEIWDPERGQGGHLYVCVPLVSGSHAGLCQDRCCSHRDLRWIQRRVLGWENHGL